MSARTAPIAIALFALAGAGLVSYGVWRIHEEAGFITRLGFWPSIRRPGGGRKVRDTTDSGMLLLYAGWDVSRAE